MKKIIWYHMVFDKKKADTSFKDDICEMKNKFTALESELHVVKWLLTTLLNTLKL